MKPGPIIAMVLLIFLGVWLVVQPTLSRGQTDLTVNVGSAEIRLARCLVDGEPGYKIVAPASMRNLDPFPYDQLDEFLAEQIDAWNERPALERHLLGFFNITRWTTFGWVALGLVGQGAFFGRMLVQWVVSERSRVSTVPEIFWWFSFLGGLCLFVYFVWRVDFVGVLGQSTGIVIYARNLRLIHIEKQRCAAPIDPSAEPEPSP